MPGIHTEEAFEEAIEAHLLANGYIEGEVTERSRDPEEAIP